MTEKFSAYALALPTNSSPLLTDFLVGVPAAGGAAYQYSLALLATLLGPTPPNTQTGTSYTLVLTDAGGIVEMNNASANTLTVPPNSSVAFPVGVQITVVQLGAGVTTVAAGAGVTILCDGSLALSAQYAGATLYQRVANTWILLV